MPLSRALRIGAIAGLSAVDAVAAHAGPAGVADARWLAVAAVGGAVAVVTLVCAFTLAATLHNRSVRVARGDPTDVPQVGAVVDATPFAVLVAVMLVCQGSAHVALLAAGVPSHTGALLGPALHGLLAVAGAAAIWLAGKLLTDAAQTLVRVVAAALIRLFVHAAVWHRARLDELPHAAARAGAVRGRAPPTPA